MNSPRAVLEWQMESGADEAVEDVAQNWLAAPPAPKPPRIKESPAPVHSSVAAPMAPAKAIAQARALADDAASLEELEKAVRGFEGCSLKKFATNTVFADGTKDAPVMVIGEAPGAQEDMQGIPFCGPSGMLLDKMLGSIGLSRSENAYITNTVFWRPPGNRQPNSEELAVCEPFLEKHIALKNPTLLILSGGVAASAVLKSKLSMGRLRGKFHDYTNTYLDKEVPVAVIFHPSYLLRSPGQKRLAWHDLLAIEDFLKR